MTYRLKYSRDVSVQFVSHLETILVFDRAGRRAKLPISYSQGFSPKPQMVFGAPAAVGMTSSYEIMDLQLDNEMPCDELLETYNKNLPRGFVITRCELLNATSKHNIMSLVGASSYRIIVSFIGDIENVQNVINKVMASKELIVPKRSKKGIVDKNIRDMIYKLEIYKSTGDTDVDFDRKFYNTYEENNTCCLDLILQSGNFGSLKPELLVSAMNLLDSSQEIDVISIHRNEILIRDKNELMDPFDYEVRCSI